MKKKVKSAILDLENLVGRAEELHAVTLLHYDSFVESKAFAENSDFYKTATSVIERLAGELSEALKANFNELYALIKEKSPCDLAGSTRG